MFHTKPCILNKVWEASAHAMDVILETCPAITSKRHMHGVLGGNASGEYIVTLI